MTSNPDEGWHIAPAGNRIDLEQTEAGRFALPMVSVHEGQTIARLNVVFTGGQIESMYHQMQQLHDTDMARFHRHEPPRLDLKAEMGRWN